MQKRETCPNKAEVQYAWGGRIFRVCLRHANSMAIISAYTGNVFNAEKIVTEMMCEHPDDLNLDKGEK